MEIFKKKEIAERKILSRNESVLSPWVRLVQKEVEFSPGQAPESYHCFAQADYIAILAQTPDGKIPIVRQYRPAVEAYTWEFPAGLLEVGEDPIEASRRELKEEAGLDAVSIVSLGEYFTDTGRLENKQHVFYVRTLQPNSNFVSEQGMCVAYVTLEELKARIRSKEFQHQLHIAVLALYELLIVKH